MRIQVFINILVLGCFWWWGSIIEAAAKDNQFIVVIDAGHGGRDPGAIGKRAKEKNINLSVALALGKLIENNCKDTKVIYTRKTDVFVPLERRAQIGNNAKADLFISIHTNALPKGKIVRGTETYTLGMARADENLAVAKRENSVILVEDNYKERYAGFNPNSSESYIMFEFMQDKYMEQSIKLAKLVQRKFRNHAKRLDKGVHQAGFLVLRATSMPSILIELGYISTPDEEQYLCSNAGVTALSQSIYKAFVDYKNQQRKGAVVLLAETNEKTDAKIVQDSNSATSSAVSAEKINRNSNAEPKAQNIPLQRGKQTNNSKPIFKVQILTSSNILPAKSRKLKGVAPVYYKENGIYKYTYGETTDYNEILRSKKRIDDKFKDAFIIAFKNGQKMNIQEAIKEFKQNKK